MKKQVFILEMVSTRNQSWQGNIKWVEKHKQQSFRSMLEMMRLIDSAMGGEAAAEEPGELQPAESQVVGE